MSGGERKRAALALAFALEPDLLLLDEPTNHLDVDGIETLEELLQRNVTCVVITHDRRFLDRVGRRASPSSIAACCACFPGNYSVYEQRKAEIDAAEDLAHRRFEKFWAQEEVWIRKGVEARRTRNEGRVKRLEHLREERAARRERIGSDQAHGRHRRTLRQAGGRVRERQQEFRRAAHSRRRVACA